MVVKVSIALSKQHLNKVNKMQESTEQTSINDLVAQRKEKLAQLREQGSAYRNDFRRDHVAAKIHQLYQAEDTEALSVAKHAVKLAGRIMTRRLMGKASFIHVQDMSGRIQIYLRKNDLVEGLFDTIKHWDIGDIIGVTGYVFRTKTGELSVHADHLVLLTKALRPLPDKYHGLADQELCYRQRYLDLLVNEDSRRVFEIRSKVIASIRQFLCARDFMEVETPMMQVMAGGALARPFITHHNTLDMDLFLRVAPELYLKRLVVGGFEKVFEINRNFRNEGLSTRHNPEFTMLEFYQAYADYQDLMNISEEMFRFIAQAVLGGLVLNHQGETIDFSKPFTRMTVKESVLHYNPEIQASQLEDLAQARKIADGLGITVLDGYGLGKVVIEIFEKTVESRLMQPTFITAYPTEVSPLSRRNDDDPEVTDRFELFVGGREIANGFSELNDPEDQAQRFEAQVKERSAGDAEAMSYDHDYIRALEHGLAPTAGEGIGIDRLVMLFADVPSIRDVILFPLMKPRTE
jgi:lysyl-tRNA synthetase class 2